MTETEGKKSSADIEPTRPSAVTDFVMRNPTMTFGMILLVLIVLTASAAPYLNTTDPVSLNPIKRLRPPSAAEWFGTDMFGRDLYSRTLFGGRISLIVGLSVGFFSTLIGLAIGMVSGYNRLADAVIMRIMDGLMAIPSILLAIALMALTKASIRNVIFAITIVNIPRVVRLVRGVVLTLREEPYVEAAVAIGTKFPKILIRHILPNTLAPLIVQATYVSAQAIIIESLLSFLGAGTPPEIPSWGNIMAEGRIYFQIATWIIMFPGIFLAVTVLSINLVGDGLRDLLDPRIARRM